MTTHSRIFFVKSFKGLPSRATGPELKDWGTLHHPGTPRQQVKLRTARPYGEVGKKTNGEVAPPIDPFLEVVRLGWV